MAEATGPAPAAGLPTLAEALGWIGFELDDAGGSRVGRIEAVFTDASGGEPIWLIVRLVGGGLLHRRHAAKVVAVPVRDCAGMAGRAWTAHGGQALRAAPTVDPARPLLREHEAAICAHYGIGERVGRHAEVAGRPEGTVTAQPTT
jgi:hypothetical protein